MATGFLLVGAVFSAAWAAGLWLRWSLVDFTAKMIVREYRPIGLRFKYSFGEFVGVRRVLVNENDGEPYRIDVVLDRRRPQGSFVFTSFTGVPFTGIGSHDASQRVSAELAKLVAGESRDEGFHVTRV